VLGLGAAIVAASLAGAVAAFLGVVGFVGPECPGYDDEGLTAAPGSVYARVMCAGAWEVPAVVVVVGVVGLLVAVALAVALAGRPVDRTVSAMVPVGVALVAPLVVLVLLHSVLPEDCLTGADGPACERDAELR